LLLSILGVGVVGREADIKPKRNYNFGPMDNCQTPYYGIEPLIPYLRQFTWVWECASGEGYLAKALIRHVPIVESTDISKGEDFLAWQPDHDRWDCIITNVPFSIKHLFLERAFELKKPFAFILPDGCLGTARVQKAIGDKIEEMGVIYPSARINFKMPYKGWLGTGAQMVTAWYTWGFGFTGNRFYDASHWNKAYRAQFEI